MDLSILIVINIIKVNQSAYRNTALVSSVVSLTSWGEDASLDLVGHPSSDGIDLVLVG